MEPVMANDVKAESILPFFITFFPFCLLKQTDLYYLWVIPHIILSPRGLNTKN
jgi:hypothetical protein